MYLFYSKLIENNTIEFDASESLHCSKVLRYKSGDTVHVTDGLGHLFTGKVLNSNTRKTIIEIIDKTKFERERNYSLHIAIAPTKNFDRFAWFVEKAVEIGIDTITPIVCQFSERRKIKSERINKVAVAAMKQSLKYYKPQIDEIVDFNSFVKLPHVKEKFIAYCKSDKKMSMVNKIKHNVLLLIGPEGGFSDAEYEMANKYNFLPIKFTESRLRTETAGVYAATALNLIFDV